MFLLRPHRPLDPIDYIFVMWKGFMQYSLEFEDKTAVKPAVEELIRCVNAFRNQAGWVWINEANQKTEVHRIPAHLNTLEEVNKWMYDTHTPSLKKALATIAADDTRVVVNAIHTCGDGVWIARLLEHICKPSEYGKRACAAIPDSIYHKWRKDYGKVKVGESILCAEDKMISRIFARLPPEQKHPVFNIQYVREPLTAFACYSKEKGRCEKLTENLWTSIGLANAAHCGKLMPFGQATVFDLRRLVGETGVEAQNYVASIPVHGNATREKTVGQLGAEMRDEFERMMRNKVYLEYMKEVHNAVFKPWTSRPIPGLGLEMSSIGQINIQNPVKDIHITLSTPGDFELTSVSCLNYTTSHLERGTQEFTAELQYTTKELHPEDARLIGESIRYALRNFNGRESVGQAFDELVAFQKLIGNPEFAV